MNREADLRSIRILQALAASGQLSRTTRDIPTAAIENRPAAPAFELPLRVHLRSISPPG